jgi:hypothetical protein
MIAFALVTGSLWKPPEQKTSKAGKPFVTATIRAKDGEALQWWRVTVFSESAQAEIMRLAEGDSLAVQGSFRAELYTPDGGVPKERKSPQRDAAPRGGAAAFNDSIPFGCET